MRMNQKRWRLGSASELSTLLPKMRRRALPTVAAAGKRSRQAATEQQQDSYI